MQRRATGWQAHRHTHASSGIECEHLVVAKQLSLPSAQQLHLGLLLGGHLVADVLIPHELYPFHPTRRATRDGRKIGHERRRLPRRHVLPLWDLHAVLPSDEGHVHHRRLLDLRPHDRLLLTHELLQLRKAGHRGRAARRRRRGCVDRIGEMRRRLPVGGRIWDEWLLRRGGRAERRSTRSAYARRCCGPTVVTSVTEPYTPSSSSCALRAWSKASRAAGPQRAERAARE